MKLLFNVVEQTITRLDGGVLASDSVQYITGEVTFGAGWENITSKWLTFEKGTTAYKATLTDNAFDESINLSLTDGWWAVSAHGVHDGGQRIPTAPMYIEVLKAGGIDGDAPLEIPLTEAEQILITADTAFEKATQALELANDTQNTAATKAAEAEASAAAALLSEQHAATSETNAKTSETNAAGSAVSAAGSAEQAALSVLGGGYVGFEIGEDGCLYCTRTSNLADTLNFAITDDGELEVTISG